MNNHSLLLQRRKEFPHSQRRMSLSHECCPHWGTVLMLRIRSPRFLICHPWAPAAFAGMLLWRGQCWVSWLLVWELGEFLDALRLETPLSSSLGSSLLHLTFSKCCNELLIGSFPSPLFLMYLLSHLKHARNLDMRKLKDQCNYGAKGKKSWFGKNSCLADEVWMAWVSLDCLGLF